MDTYSGRGGAVKEELMKMLRYLTRQLSELRAPSPIPCIEEDYGDDGVIVSYRWIISNNYKIIY